jgi:hypothetical protein
MPQLMMMNWRDITTRRPLEYILSHGGRVTAEGEEGGRGKAQSMQLQSSEFYL